MAQQTILNENDHALSPAWTPRILRVRATITGLESPCIPFALMDYDPLPAFLRYCEPAAHKGHVAQLSDRDGSLREAWEQAFATLAAEQRFFLYAWSATAGASPRVVQAASLIVGIATPGPRNTRWLTTRAFWRQGELVAWREEIAMHEAPGSERVKEIVLGEENMIRLQALALSQATHVA